MAENKYYLFFELLANKQRMEIIQLLKDKGSLSVMEIVSILKEEQSKVSHNLRKLALCNIVEVARKGNFRYYSLNPETIVPLLEIIDKHAYCSCKTCKLKNFREKCRNK